MEDMDWFGNDRVFPDMFMDDSVLLKFYGATNMMILPYLNTDQISGALDFLVFEKDNRLRMEKEAHGVFA